MKAYNKEKVEAHLLELRYRNMPNTRRAGINYVLTQEELIEWAKCHNNPIYFIEKYCKAFIDKEIKNVILRDYQKNMINFFTDKRFIIYLHSRQVGISLILSLIYLHYLLFNANQLIYIFSPKYEIRFNFLNEIKMLYVGLPFFLKKGITKWDDNNLAFENGCKIICSNTKNIDFALQQNENINIFHIMDMAYFNDDLIKRSYLSILPYIASNNSKLVISSVAKKEAKFLADLVEYSELPDEAPDKNVFETMRIYWWQENSKEEIKKQMDDWLDDEFDLKFY